MQTLSIEKTGRIADGNRSPLMTAAKDKQNNLFF
jgi:hypothetical protein